MNDTTAIVHQKLHMPQSAQEIKAQIKAIQEVMRGVMQEGVHYGTIPGTDKPALYKPGSEILLTTFRVSVVPEIEDLSGPDEIRYRVHCKGVHMTTGTVIGVGLGEASTNEEKYKWRGCLQKEFDNTPEDRRRIKYGWKWGQVQGEKLETETLQVRTQPADLANTVLKMAKKRAQIDLTLTGLAASDVFTQDMEDVPEHLETAPLKSSKGQSQRPQRQAGNGKANAAQVKLLRTKLDQAGIGELEFFEQFEIDAFESLPFSKVNEALAWIKNLGP